MYMGIGVGYSLSANWQSYTGDQYCSFVYISNISSDDVSTSNVQWYDYHYPNSVNNSANSVYLNNTISFYETVQEVYAHACIATFSWTEMASDDNTGDTGLKWQLWVIIISAVMVVCIFVGVYVYRRKYDITEDKKSLLKPRETSIDITI